MALFTLAELLSEVTDEIPSMTSQQAKVVRAINKVVRRIYTEFVEPARGTFTTLPAVSTGTVLVTQDSTSVTFSGSVLGASDPLRLVQVDGDQAWFGLARVSGTAGTLSSKWAEATNATATYSIIYPTNSFPAEVGEILSIWREGFEPLKFASDARLMSILPQVTTGVPTHWSPYLHDEASTTPNNDLRRIFMTPVSTTRMVFAYTYKPRFTFLTIGGATTQTIPLNDVWYESIIAGALFWLWKGQSDHDRAFTQLAVYEKALERARAAELPSVVIRPKRSRSGIFAYENRPIGG